MLSPILACQDVDKAIEYYTQKLGFELAWAMPPNEQGEVEIASVKLDEAEILLGVTEGFVAAEDISKRGTGIQLYINLPPTIQVDDLYQHAVEQEAHITKPIETRDWGERAFNVKDIDGYDLMFAQQGDQKGRQ
jgi:uncharacterized glyoxalase superfamily protein PhnB